MRASKWVLATTLALAASCTSGADEDDRAGSSNTPAPVTTSAEVTTPPTTSETTTPATSETTTPATSETTAPATTAADAPAHDTDLTVALDLPVADVTEMDVVAAVDDGTSRPTAVVLHGTLGDRSLMHPFARALAADGAVVFVPSWPVLDRPDPLVHSPEGYLAQVEAVVCSLRAARVAAPDYGGDPDDVTLIGFSGGGMVGAAVSLVADPPWDGIDCLTGVDHAPTTFIGIDGDYLGRYQWSGAQPEEFAPFAPVQIQPTRLPTIRLFAGLNDQNVNAYDAGVFLDRALDLGADARLVVSGAKHGDAVDPTTAVGAFVVDQVGALMAGTQPASDAPTDALLELTFDGDRCEFSGPATPSAGDLIGIEYHNVGDEQASFGLASVYLDADLTVVAAPPRDPVPVNQPPPFVYHGGFRTVAPDATATETWLVDADYHWLPLCAVDDPAADDYLIVVRPTDDDGEFVLLTVS